jgi:hypothetical protein
MLKRLASSLRVGALLAAIAWIPVSTALLAGTSAVPAGAILAGPSTAGVGLWSSHAETPRQSRTSAPQVPRQQSDADAAKKSAGCLTCHKPDSPSMHANKARAIGCTDCHGGDASASAPAGAEPASGGFRDAKRKAHVQPRLDIWKSSANPVRSAAQVLRESLDFIRFVNPGDLRVVDQTCAPCHLQEVTTVRTSMMVHGAMLWGAAAYNNGAAPNKQYTFGEFYTRDGRPGKALADPPPSPRDTSRLGHLPFLEPLWRWEISQPGNVLRIFEDGGRKPIEQGVPDPEEQPGRPAGRFSNRGYGTLNRTDPVFIGLQKTRLLDPTLNFFGTNDQPGDYRSSGCTGCHTIYANDRSQVTAAGYASAGNEGRTQTSDPMIPKNESGHPISHTFTKAIPTSQCMVCHMHPGTNMVATYLGLTWWDNETEGDRMYPARALNLGGAKRVEVENRNPEGSAVRGLWSDTAFLGRTGTREFNTQLRNTQFADFHGHGWLYRAVFKRDRKGNLIDAQSEPVRDASGAALNEAFTYQNWPAPVADDTPAPTRLTPHSDAPVRAGLPVHLKDIHLERGMQCVDCHFKKDSHGDGNLYGETRNAVEIDCVDCHGTVSRRATLHTSGTAAVNRGAEDGGIDMTDLSTPFDTKQFQAPAGNPALRATRPYIQRSMVVKGLQWEIPQVVDSVTPGNPRYNQKSAWAKLVKNDGRSWGAAGATDLAHKDERMTCYTCHSAWVTSCFGCHLSQRANEKRPMLHNEGIDTRNWTSYNFQVLRDDVFMLGIDGTVTGNRIAPVRSSSAVVVSSEDINRQKVYFQQQTISAEGYAGQAFNTHVPHTVRGRETKSCTDCHASAAGDNNAAMAQLVLQGTNFVNFMGRFVYVATGQRGIDAVAVTEKEEPQAVIGSDLHKMAYPDEYAAHEKNGRRLTTAIHHGSSEALSIQQRGEYVYIADGSGGFRVFDIAQVNQKGFSQKIVTSPVSPFGQDTSVKTRYATAVASPTTLGVDPLRTHAAENQEQPISLVYGFIYVTDREEGLVVSTAAPLLDGNPRNNFLERAAQFNPNGLLTGAVNLTIAGNYAYIVCPKGLIVVDISNPLAPKLAGQVDTGLREPHAVAVQFRYAFVTDADGLKVVDVTIPTRPRLVANATVPIESAAGLYVARTYAYVASGAKGLTIVDVERPEQPKLDQVFDASGQINDARDVKVGMTNASVFAYIADGRNGLRVVQLVSGNRTPGAYGFSPKPAPELIATYKTSGPALAISKGLDRDRAVDESGNQLAVFGRRGARPFNLEEMKRLYLRGDQLWTVGTTIPTRPAAARTTSMR